MIPRGKALSSTFYKMPCLGTEPVESGGEKVPMIPLPSFCRLNHLSRNNVRTLLRKGEVIGFSSNNRIYVNWCPEDYG